jgi:tRNA1Val (adenine37-N6)-methyltransferase
MANDYFQFKQFTVRQQHCAMKVTTDGCLFGAWVAGRIVNSLQMTVDRGQRTDNGLQMTDGRGERVASITRPLANRATSETSEPQLSGTGQPSSVIRHLSTALDIGTGTGLLGLMLAQQTELCIDAVEIDPAAAAQAAENMAASPWANRLRVITGDITQLPLGQQYPIIVSNPPFFENQLASPHEGRQKALHATELSLVALFTAIEQYLSPQGIAFLLLPAYRRAELEALAAQYGFYVHQLVTVRQTPRHQPFRLLIQLGKQIQPLSESELIIRESDGRYSEGFIDLLKAYYLYL